MTEELLLLLLFDFDNDDNGRFWATQADRQRQRKGSLIRLMKREDAVDGVSANDQVIIRASGRKDAETAAMEPFHY